MLSVALLFQVIGVFSATTNVFDRNLVYGSPFTEEHPKLSHDTNAIQARHITHVKRQLGDASGFTDEHYATFYGSDMSNSPFIWTDGINFTHSVASGDPFDTSVLLWTRAIPISTGTVLLDSVPICLKYTIATLSNPHDIIDSGAAFTSYDVDFTVKVEATGLLPDTKYTFHFSDCANPATVSPVGTTRTLSSPETPATEVNGGEPMTLAVFSCSQFQAGWFNAYGFAAHNTSADVFIHLGDYIYESIGNGASIGRQTLGRELATVADYRQRYNQYRTDTSLIAAHQHAPWITDDHEIADNAWKAGTADSNDTALGCSFSASGACFTDRKLAGVRAYHEWMPVRQVTVDNKLRIWRNFQIGKLVDLTMLDTRQYDRDLTDVYYNTVFRMQAVAVSLWSFGLNLHLVVNVVSGFENRSMMGFDQEKWFFDTISQSKKRGAVWRIVGQQVVFTQLNESNVYDLDAWDGYRANRERIIDYLYNNSISNTVILSGDSHANWVSDLAHPNDTINYDPITGDGAIGVEFAGTAVTSGSSFGTNISPSAADVISTQLVSSEANLNLQWSEGSYRGFFTLVVDSNSLNATYYAMQNITFANLDAFASAKFSVIAGANKLSRPVAGGQVNAGVLKTNSTM